MQELELAARIRTLRALSDVVGAMRTLAAVRQRQAQERFAGLARYATATRAALAQGLALLGAADAGAGSRVQDGKVPPGPDAGPRLAIACFSEHGFVGGLNEEVLRALLDATASPGPAPRIQALGSRGLRLCSERGVRLLCGAPMPTTLAGLQATANRLTEEVFADLAEEGYASVELFFMRHLEGSGRRVERLSLFPLQVEAAPPTEAQRPPLHPIPAGRLVPQLVEEYCFAQISWALVESFAAEHSARFQMMEAARRNMDEQQAELGQLERVLRQEIITSEILEVASGAAAMEERS